ncbi:NUDIX domain-containing protein [Lentzea sp. NPDC051213]|uniref:NUDIX domain-containing protein n=1 Tax=Lentzea sp. NPDC051213 TaxID=3364126 RepID=UPI00379EBB72
MAGLTDDEARFAYLAEGNAKQARKRVAADVLIRDDRGRILLVNPTYKDHWDLPGGMVENNEPPRKAAERELREELGLKVIVDRILVLEWVGPHGPWDDQLVFIFDGGTLTEDQLASLRPIDPEISELALLEQDEAARRLRPDMTRRLGRALQALVTGSTHYTE